jgi:hypothetical protein
MKVDGGCVCGHITYEAEVDPDQVGLCNCTDCQVFSGSAFRVGVPTPEADFNLLSGALKTYVKTAESGNKRAQVFCPDCGAHLYSTSIEDGPKIFRLRTGTMNQRNDLPPTTQGWHRSAQAWVADIGSIPSREKQ